MSSELVNKSGSAIVLLAAADDWQKQEDPLQRVTNLDGVTNL